MGIIAAIFLPYVFTLINWTGAFTNLNNGFQALAGSDPSGLEVIFSGGFLIQDNDLLEVVYNPNLIRVFTGENDFIDFLPAMLTWIVCGLLAALFSQSVKKGVISSLVFVIVEILLFLLMQVFAGLDLQDVLGFSNPDIVDGFVIGFLGKAVVTPVGFSVAGGAIGGAISQFAFGPEEI